MNSIDEQNAYRKLYDLYAKREIKELVDISGQSSQIVEQHECNEVNIMYCNPAVFEKHMKMNFEEFCAPWSMFFGTYMVFR